MLNPQQKVLLPELRRLIGCRSAAELDDRQLLERFLAAGDAAAFAELVRRHGRTVLGVCRRILNHHHDAEDAFQATFLVLVRRARTIARREALGSWLYGVAYRIALKARASIRRRQRREGQAAAATVAAAPPGDDGWNELRPILDEEVNRLPDKYRLPVVLCYFEGKTYAEAARLLGWPAGTASTRLARARELLRARLADRGVTVSATALAAGLAGALDGAAQGPALTDAVTRAALRLAVDPGARGIAAPVLSLTEGMVKAMLMQKVKTLASLLLVVLVACAAGGLVYRAGLTAPAAAAGRQPGEDGVSPAGEVPAAPLARLPAPWPNEPEPPAMPEAAEDQPPKATPPRALAPPAADGRPLSSRIGLINISRVLKTARPFQAAQTDLRTRTRKLQERLQSLHARAEQLRSDRLATDAVEGPFIQARLADIQAEIERVQRYGQKQLESSSSSAVVRMYRQVEEAANRIARANGLELVLFYTDAVSEADFYNPGTLQRKLTQPGALMPLIVAPGMDITQTVIDALDHLAAATGAGA